MIYTGLNRTGEIESVKAHGGGDVAEVYGGINESNPIYYKTRTLIGQTPLSYKALSKPLSDYLISGNTIQDGTPTPDAPVDVVGCGVWDETQQSYKLPIAVNGTEHPIYLGQVETTRRIKKLVLTGKEDISGVHESSTAGVYCASMRYSNCGATDIIDYNKIMANIAYPYFVCSHLKMKKTPSSADVWYDISEGEIGANSYSPDASILFYNLYFIFCIPGCTTKQDFQNYFAAQYAAGTPVTIWYILAAPAISITNEPLHKIGDYADTISFEQADVTIPTVAGTNTLAIDTIVQPSVVSITGNIKEVSA